MAISGTMQFGAAKNDKLLRSLQDQTLDLNDDDIAISTVANTQSHPSAASGSLPAFETAVNSLNSAPISGSGDGAPSAPSAFVSPVMAFAAAPAAPGAGTQAPSNTTSSSTSGTVSGTNGTAPAWVGTLSTASIAADMAAAIVNGAVTYSGLEKLIADLANTLSTTKTTLTSAQFNDLKTIVANLNNGVTTSSYLSSVMNSLVNGNASNAKWTGGAASSVALGNLAVGSTATQLTELNGKWLLGTDRPSSSVSMSGASTFNVSYSASSKPLFASAGPSMSDINQGYLGDCYLLSSLAEVANQNSSVITSMFTDNGNGTYGVRFYVNGQAQYVTVDSTLANGGSIFNKDGSANWASLAEKAYAQLSGGGVVSGNGGANYGNSFSSIGNGGAPEYALEEITGASTITDFYASGSTWTNVVYNSNLAGVSQTSGNTTASELKLLIKYLAEGDDVILSSWTNAKDSAGKTTLVASHALSIYGYDSSTNMLQIRNPWGSANGQYWDTTFEVTLDTLLAAGDTITIDNVGASKKPAPPAPPVVSNQTATQTWGFGQAVNFTLPANTFTDPQGQKLTYSATLANGSALPSWLTFNAATGTFSGTAPGTATTLSLKVTATDTSGLSASETFTVQTQARAPVLNTQTAAQTWGIGQAVNFTLPANTFTDPQGQKLTYSATQANGSALPSWLTFNAATGTFSGTAPGTATSLTLKVTATDTSGLSASETFTVATQARAPVLNTQTAAQTWGIGQAVNFTLPANTFTDPQGQKLTYSATQANGSALPSWLSFNSSTGTFSGTAPGTATSLTLKVTATDTSGLSASETFTVATQARAPVVSAQTAAQTWATGKAVNLALAANTFTDPQGDKLIYSATMANGSALPSWLKFNAATETFTGTAPTAATTLSIKVTAADAHGLSVSETFNASITAAAAGLTHAISSIAPDSGMASVSQIASQSAQQQQTLASPL